MKPVRLAVFLICAAATTAGGFALQYTSPATGAGTRLPCSATVRRVIGGASAEVTRGVRYDASYRVIGYPNGDVPRDRGACTDVLVRAFRANGVDLQKRIHEDMARRFSAYPTRYGLVRPDSNIDHRRVPNLRVFFARFGQALSTSTSEKRAAAWRPGDIVFWKLPGGVLDHCGILTDSIGPSGFPTVVHNLGGAAEEDCLRRWTITGHIRYPPESGQ